MDQGLALVRIIEELAYERSKTRNAIGSFVSTSALLDSAEMLHAKHNGLFAFVAFHANQDPFVLQYMQSGSVSHDAGRNVMVLVLSNTSCDYAEDLLPSMLVGDVAVSQSTHPAYELVGKIFTEHPRPVFPGLLVFDSIYGLGSAIYVSLSSCETSKAVGDLCRKVFSYAEESYSHSDSSSWPDRLSAHLLQQSIGYRRTDGVGMREWLEYALEASKSLGVTLIALFPKILAKWLS